MLLPVVDVREPGAGDGDHATTAEGALAHADAVPPLKSLLFSLFRLVAPTAADDENQGQHGDQCHGGVDDLEGQLRDGGWSRQSDVLVHLAEAGQHEIAGDGLNGPVDEHVAAVVVQVVDPHLKARIYVRLPMYDMLCNYLM